MSCLNQDLSLIHILWNHNVEFIEQEENWERPAVFVEFCPIRWNAIVDGVEYRAEPEDVYKRQASYSSRSNKANWS